MARKNEETLKGLKEECDNCRFFEPLYGGSNKTKLDLGECHFNPPVFRYWTEGVGRDLVLCSEEYFPKVNSSNWCGKYQIDPEIEREWLMTDVEGNNGTEE